MFIGMHRVPRYTLKRDSIVCFRHKFNFISPELLKQNVNQQKTNGTDYLKTDFRIKYMPTTVITTTKAFRFALAEGLHPPCERPGVAFSSEVQVGFKLTRARQDMLAEF
jgi:hypothetical protein